MVYLRTTLAPAAGKLAEANKVSRWSESSLYPRASSIPSNAHKSPTTTVQGTDPGIVGSRSGRLEKPPKWPSEIKRGSRRYGGRRDPGSSQTPRPLPGLLNQGEMTPRVPVRLEGEGRWRTVMEDTDP